jgi:hypothetical protein
VNARFALALLSLAAVAAIVGVVLALRAHWDECRFPALAVLAGLACAAPVVWLFVGSWRRLARLGKWLGFTLWIGLPAGAFYLALGGQGAWRLAGLAFWLPVIVWFVWDVFSRSQAPTS